MQVTDRGTGRVAGEPTLEDERQWPRREARVVPVGVVGGGGGKRKTGASLATCPQPDSARGRHMPHWSPGSATLEGRCRGDRDSEELMSWK